MKKTYLKKRLKKLNECIIDIPNNILEAVKILEQKYEVGDVNRDLEGNVLIGEYSGY